MEYFAEKEIIISLRWYRLKNQKDTIYKSFKVQIPYKGKVECNLFKFNFQKEDTEIPDSVKRAIEDIEKERVKVFKKAYDLITDSRKAKIIPMIYTIFVTIIWFLALEYYRYYNGTGHYIGPLSNLFQLIPIPKDDLIVKFSLQFFSVLLTIFFIGGAISFLSERLRLERHISNGTIGIYLKRKGTLAAALSLFLSLSFYLFIIQDMQEHRIFIRDVIVFVFIFISIFTYYYNKTVFKFCYYMKNEVDRNYLQALHSIMEDKKHKEK